MLPLRVSHFISSICALFVDVFPQPHQGEVRKKYICYIKSPFVLSRRLETGASLSSVYAISVSAFVGRPGGVELRGGDENVVLFFKQAWGVW